MRDWQAAKQEVQRLKQKLSEATNLKEIRKHMDTRELMKKDKDNHRLGLQVQPL
jgi:hypothetical protein